MEVWKVTWGCGRACGGVKSDVVVWEATWRCERIIVV